MADKTTLTVNDILAAARWHHEDTGKWPTQTSGDASGHGLTGWTWSNVNAALARPTGWDGAAPGSLPKLLIQHGLKAADVKAPAKVAPAKAVKPVPEKKPKRASPTPPHMPVGGSVEPGDVHSSGHHFDMPKRDLLKWRKEVQARDISEATARMSKVVDQVHKAIAKTLQAVADNPVISPETAARAATAKADLPSRMDAVKVQFAADLEAAHKAPLPTLHPVQRWPTRSLLAKKGA